MQDEDSDIFKRIKRLEDDLRGFKTAQPVGTDSVVAYTTQSNNIWDVDTTLPANTLGFGNSSSMSFEVRFEAYSQQAPFAKCRVFASSTIPVYYTSIDTVYATVSEIIVDIRESTYYIYPVDAANPQLYRYTVTVYGPQFTAFKLKFAMDATDYGRMSAIQNNSSGGTVIVP